MFLLMTLPQVMAWHRERKNGLVPAASLVMIGVSLWSRFIVKVWHAHGATFVFKEICSWVLPGLLSYLLAASLPGWLCYGRGDDARGACEGQKDETADIDE